MPNLNNALIMGNIYDPDTDSQFILMRVTAKEWDRYKQELDKIELIDMEDRQWKTIK